MSVPNFFYKYVSLNDNTLDALKHSYLWFSDLQSFNDPLDMNFEFTDSFARTLFDEASEKFERELTQKFNQKNKSYPEAYFRELFEGLRNNKCYHRKTAMLLLENIEFSVFCLSEDPCSNLMWSHYADGHQGLCLMYDFKKSLKIQDDIRPVIYSNSFPKMDNAEDLIDNIIFQKSEEWKYEKEWRIVRHSKGPRNINRKDLHGIILGLKAQDHHNYNTLVETLDDYQNIELLKMNKKEGSYLLEMVKINSL